jgi:uncharacterized membrane protein
MRKEVILPALGAAGALAIEKGPQLVQDLTERLDGAREQVESKVGEKVLDTAKDRLDTQGGLAGKLLSKAIDAGGGGGNGGKKTRRLPIQRWTDVAVPVGTAYDAWTDFNQFPKFMHRVLNVRQKGADRVAWQEKVWFSTREWEGRITDRRKNDRIAWKTTSGTSHRGVVSFHELDDHLTRVMVTMEFEPSGMIEKMASGLRFVTRAVQSDLARFKAYVEMEDAKGIEYRSSSQRDDQKDNSDDERGRREKAREARRKKVGRA